LIRLLHAYFPKRTLYLGISEACLVALAFVAATIARLGPNDATLMLGYERGTLKILVVSAAFIACMYYFDLYNSSILRNRHEMVARLVAVLGTVCILLALLYYVDPALELGRGIFLIGFALVAAVLWFWRQLFSVVNSQPQFAERTLVFGDGPLARSLLKEFESRPELGLRVVSHVLQAGNGTNEHNGSDPEFISGAIEPIGREDLLHAVKFHRVIRIVVAMGDRRGKLPLEILLSLKSRGVRV
jgi:FlaA1/EpsC-like NDP-sugar epimerase